jgi:hypothetical protein
MPSKLRQKKRARPTSKGGSTPRRPAAAKKPARPAARKASAPPPRPSGAKASSKTAAAGTAPPLEVPLPDGRRHVLSLSFVRDGDEFLARLETDSGHITELKNRSLDQLLTLVASELEDLLE